VSTPRNAPCPCGSGKKSKRCCNDPAKLAREQQEQLRAWEARMAELMRQPPNRKIMATMLAPVIAAGIG